MRQLNLYLLMLCSLCVLYAKGNVSTKSYDSTTGFFYLMTKDGHEDYEVDGSVTFKASSKTTIPTYKDNGVTFSPKNVGEVIIATVEEIDLDGGNYLLSYDGAVETGKYGLSDGVNQSSYLPAGWTNKIVKGSEGLVITSGAEDGKLTFGYHSGSAQSQVGFTIKIQSVVPKDMEFVSASAYSPSKNLYRGAKNQIILGAVIKTSGVNTPLTLDKVSFDLTSLTSSQVSNLRIYNGSISADNLLTIDNGIGSIVSCTPASTLISGDNFVYVVCDLAPDFVGNIPTCKLTSVQIGGNAKTITDAEAISVVDNSILMPSDRVVYNISDVVKFFDDGGIDGKVGEQFEGSVTFVPTNPTQKIKIDFSKLEIFNTSSTGLNDVFKFYSGREVDESQLITTLLKEAKIVKSVAEDGSLTVTFKSTTGVPANGWEAEVSQFTPGNMSFDEAVAENGTLISAPAYSNDNLFSIFDVKTSNELNPLVLNEIALSLAGTTKLDAIAKIKIYSLGDKKTFTTTNLVTEVAPTTEGLTIPCSAELKEGHNYFAIAIDFSSKGLNGEVVKLQTRSVKVGDVTTTFENLPAVEVTISNIFYHTPGTEVREIYDNWKFTDTKSAYSPGKYEYTKDDCIVTFRPAEVGKQVELSFSKFDVYYSDSSYGTKALFEVYQGSEVNEDNLLWRLASAAQSTTGPQKVFRSSSADGAITIKFNANTTYSSSAGNGWEADVVLFQNKAMEISEINVSQASTEDLTPGSKNQEILKLCLKTRGNLTTQIVKEIKLGIKNSALGLDKVHILYGGNTDDIANAVEFETAEYTEGEDITITGTQPLVEGDAYFYVLYDVKDDAPVNTQLDATLISIKTEDENPYTPANGDPEGERLVKNILLLQNGDNGAFTLSSPMEFYDNGGADKNYTNGFDGNVTFIPSSEDKIVKLTFNSFRTSASHYFYVYNGKSIDDENLVGKYYSSNAPASLISTAPDGSLTIRFVAASGTTYAGWDVTAESYTPTALAVSSVVTTPVATESIVRGTSDTPMMKIAINIEGDKGVINLDNIKGSLATSTNSADVTNTKLWYTADKEGFNPINQIASSTTSEFEFVPTSAVSINKAGTYYLHITATVAGDAVVSNNVVLDVNSVSLNEVVFSDFTAKTATTTLKGGFKGEYTIGSSSSANYSTITSAIAALKDGVEGPVTFSIEPGTYTENILIKDIAGAGENSPIVFTSTTGKNNDVTIVGGGYSEPAYGETKYGMVAVENTPYVTFSNMSFVPVSQDYPYCVHIYNKSRNFTLSGCNLSANPITSGYSGMYMIYTQAVNEEGGNNDYYTLENNTITGGYIALYLGGTGYVALSKEEGAVVRNNVITDAGGKGIYMTDENNAIIDGNTVINNLTQKTDYIALDIYRNKKNFKISNNKIFNNQSVYSTGLKLRTECGGDVANPALVYNNVISITQAPSVSAAGISMTTDSYNIHFVHNTISINGTAGYAISITNSYDGVKNILFENNIVQNLTPSAAINIYSAKSIPALTFKKNAYYTAGSIFATNGGETFEAWQTTMGDATSINEKAEFISESDLHLKNSGNMCQANVLADFNVDADGIVRDAKNPTIGAYEYRDIVIETPTMLEGYPIVGNVTHNSIEVKTKWNVGGKLYSIISNDLDVTPSVEELLATTATPIVATTEVNSKFTNLSDQTSFKAHFLLEAASGEKSVVYTTATITTNKYIAPLSVSFDEVEAVDARTSVTLVPNVEGGEAPYSYAWTDKMAEEVGATETITVTPELSQQYNLVVTSADGQVATAFVQVPVYGTRAIATFEDNYLDSESYWQGNTPVDEYTFTSTFFSGSYSFTNTYMPEYNFWGGFAYSNVTDTTFDPASFATHQFRSVVGEGADKSATYAVSYALGAETTIGVYSSRSGEVISGVYLTNNAYTLNSIKNGDGLTDPFKQGDYIKVIFTGDDEKGQAVEFYLADYRDSDASKHYELTEWKWCDLSPLGNVKRVSATIEASNVNIPAYFCMDNLGGNYSGIDEVTEGSNISIYPVPATTELNITGVKGEYQYRIFNVNGSLCGTEANLEGNSQVNVSDLTNGIYILEITGNEVNRTLKQFIKR